MNTIPHPQKPLHRECVQAIAKVKSTQELQSVLDHFEERRNAEFPGWRDKYEAEFAAWMTYEALQD